MSWVRGWVHVGLWILTLVVNVVILFLRNPDVLDARTRTNRLSAAFDKAIVPLLLLVTLVIPIVAGLDARRYEWTHLPLWTVYPGVMFDVAGDALLLWAMAVNPFLEGGVRIQTELGHYVVTTGPYAIVRHPMYSGFICVLAAIPLVLGSGWTVLPAGTVAAGLVVRTVFEDRMLQCELPGYSGYAEKTRYRLVPRIW